MHKHLLAYNALCFSIEFLHYFCTYFIRAAGCRTLYVIHWNSGREGHNNYRRDLVIWLVHLIYSAVGFVLCYNYVILLHQVCSLAMCQAMPEFLFYFRALRTMPRFGGPEQNALILTSINGIMIVCISDCRLGHTFAIKLCFRRLSCRLWPAVGQNADVVIFAHLLTCHQVVLTPMRLKMSEDVSFYNNYKSIGHDL